MASLCNWPRTARLQVDFEAETCFACGGEDEGGCGHGFEDSSSYVAQRTSMTATAASATRITAPPTIQ